MLCELRHDVGASFLSLFSQACGMYETLFQRWMTHRNAFEIVVLQDLSAMVCFCIVGNVLAVFVLFT